MITLALRFSNLLFGGLYAGFLLCVLFIEAALRGSPAEVYVVVEQVKHTNLNLLAMGTLVPNLAAGLLLLAFLRPVRGRAFLLTAVGVLCALAALATTLLVNVPINAAQMTWAPQSPPADWMATRDRWAAAHALRTTMALVGLTCSLFAALLVPRSSGRTPCHRPTNPTPPGAGVAEAAPRSGDG